MADDIQIRQPQPDVASAPLDFSDLGGQKVDAQQLSQSAQTSVQAHQPSVWERVQAAVTHGIPKFNSDFEVASHTDDGKLSDGSKPSMQLVTPQAAMTAQEQKDHPIATGLAESAGELTSPGSVATLAGSGGLGELGVAGKALIPRLVSAGFSAQALTGAYQKLPEFKKAMDSGDAAEAERILTHIVIESGMGILGAQHATGGAAAIEGAVTRGSKAASKATGLVGERGAVSANGLPKVNPSSTIDFSDLGGKQIAPAESLDLQHLDGAVKTPGKVKNPHVDFADLGGTQVAEAPKLLHEDGKKFNTIRLNRGDKTEGMVKYTLPPSGEASITAANIDPSLKGQGFGRKMYERAAQEAKARGASAITLDLTGTDSYDSARVWDSLMRDNPTQITKIASKTGSPGYRWDFNATNAPETVSDAPALQQPPAERGDSYAGGSEQDPARENAPNNQKPDFAALGEQAGVKFLGTMGEEFPQAAIATFQDPQSGTSIGVKLKDFSPEQLQKQIADARERMSADLPNGQDSDTVAGMAKEPTRVSGDDVVKHIMDTSSIHNENDAHQLAGLDSGGEYDLKDIPVSKLNQSNEVDSDLATKYAKRNTPLPAVVLDGDGRLRDGNHRLAAAKLRGDETIKAYVPVDSTTGKSADFSDKPVKNPFTPEELDDLEKAYPTKQPSSQSGQDSGSVAAKKSEDWKPPAGLEKGIPQSEAVESEIPLSKLSVNANSFSRASGNVSRGRGTRTPGPISVFYNPDNGQYLVDDGHHRLVEAYRRGDTTIPAKIWSGYSDTIPNVPAENRIDLSPDEPEDEER